MGEVTVLQQGGSGGNPGGGALVDLEFGSVTEFRKRLTDMKSKMDFMQEFFSQVMVKNEDYGTIPGTGKPTLYKPGAEKLCELYGFAAHIKSREEEKDYDSGFYRAVVTVQLIHRVTGVIVGEGVGECNTNESKYRYRWVYENKIPKHLSKEDLYFEEKDEWKDGAKTGKTYKLYRIPNEDLFSQWNTVLKMSHKRSLTGVTLQCTRSSGIFTQEEAEMDEWADVPEEDRKKKPFTPKGNPSGGQPKQTNNQSTGAGGGTIVAANKNRVLKLMKDAALDFNGLASEATKALNRPVKKVMDDLKTDADWIAVGDHLEFFIANKAQSSELDIDFDNLPPELR